MPSMCHTMSVPKMLTHCGIDVHLLWLLNLEFDVYVNFAMALVGACVRSFANAMTCFCFALDGKSMWSCGFVQ